MNTISSSVTIRELRANLADAVGRAGYGNERVQITKNGKPAAVLIGPADFSSYATKRAIRLLTRRGIFHAKFG